jgi:hypothetical protein
MTQSVSRRRLWRFLAVAALAVTLGPRLPRVQAQLQGAEPARQVTLFAVIAVPGSSAIDPKLAGIEPQLRRLLPGHGFTLLDVRSKRLHSGESVRCDLGKLGSGWTASTELVQALDPNGKVELDCKLLQNDVVQFDTRVATPPNQLFFCDRMIDNGKRLLIGVGAR